MARRFPGEWERHRATIVAWPRRREVWGSLLSNAYDEYAALVRLLSEDEDVLVVAHPDDVSTVASLVKSQSVSMFPFGIDDGWIRDNGPIFCWDGDVFVGVNFDFNSWGERFSPSDGDRAVVKELCQFYGAVWDQVPWVLEGGAISSNGAGALLIAEACVLSANRNPGASRPAAESLFERHLGTNKPTWVEFGLVEDLKNTDGHIDNVSIFVEESSILVQTAPPESPNHARLRANLSLLRESYPSATFVECDRLPYARMPDGSLQPSPYVNLVLTNGSVVLPTVGADTDSWAAGFFADVFPGRKVRFCRAPTMTFGGGGPHCVTMQVPAVPS